MTAAIFGLVGVVIGAALNWIATDYFARRSEKRLAVASARLVQASLGSLRSATSAAFLDRAWALGASPPKGVVAAWNSNRPNLVAALTPTEWNTLSATSDVCGYLVSRLEHLSESKRRLHKDDRAALAALLELADKAAETGEKALRRFLTGQGREVRETLAKDEAIAVISWLESQPED